MAIARVLGNFAETHNIWSIYLLYIWPVQLSLPLKLVMIFGQISTIENLDRTINSFGTFGLIY